MSKWFYLFGLAALINIGALGLNLYVVSQGHPWNLVCALVNAYFAWGSLVRIREIMLEKVEFVDNPDEN